MKVFPTGFRWAFLPAFLLVLFLATAVIDQKTPGGRGIVKIQGIDPTCYFGVAHTLLFHHDWNLSDELLVFPPSDGNWTARQPGSGLPSSPFAIGYSLLAIPFLAAGTGVDALAGNPPNGYSRFALLVYFFANVTFSVTGMFLLLKLLIEIFGRRWANYLAVGTAFFGTSLLVYSFSPMSHAATFLCVSGFLLLWYRIRDSENVGGWACLGLVGGVLGITRWQDSLFLAGPILYDLFHWRERFRAKLTYVWSRGIYAALFAVCWIPQMLEWKAIYGKYLTIPQGAGFLQWPPVHFFQVLFSTSHGWFVWTPLAAVGVAGLMLSAHRNWDRVLPWFLVMLAEIAVSGANTTNWDGSDSFSIRSLTSCLPLVTIGVCALLTTRTNPVRWATVCVSILCVLYTVLFAAQFRLDMIPRKGSLTARELIGDKVFFRGAYNRHLAHAEAGRLLREGRPKEAETVAQEAVERHAEDRFLLNDVEFSSRQAGDLAEAAWAHQHLEQLLKQRLF